MLKKLYGDSLFRNSFFLMLTSAIIAIFGFIFWLICAKIYSPSEIGLATSLISAATLVSAFSMLGFNNVIVRFLPSSNRKNEQISTAFILTSLASILVSSIFLLWAFLSHYPGVQSGNKILLIGVFMIFSLLTTINSLIENIFIAYRKTEYILSKNFILSILRLGLVLLIIEFGFLGMLSSTEIATFVACLLGYFWLIKKFKFHPLLTIDKETIQETKSFAIGNYFGTLLGVLPQTFIVLLVVSRLGASQAAFFYIPSMITTFLSVIPTSIAQSLFAEVSHDELNMEKYFKSSLKHLFSLLIPTVLFIGLFGSFILRFFGPDYALAGEYPLIILLGASIINAANTLGDTLLNIKKMPGMYLFMNALNAFAIVVPVYFAVSYGLTVVASAVFAGQSFTACIYLIMNRKLILSL